MNQNAYDELMLRIRQLLLDKELEIAIANRELTLGGGWLSDHAEACRHIDFSIETLFQQARSL